MEFVVMSLILFLLFLGAVTTSAVYLFRALKVAMQEMVKLEKERAATLKHAMNLLSSKEPMTFQQLQTVTVEPETRYTGPYLPGDEIELLEQQEREMTEAWKRLANDLDLDDGN
jgi:hypothetical protein